jgi:hypothetical protein
MASYPIRHLQLRTNNACRYTDSLDSEVGRSCRSGSPLLSSWALVLLCAPCRVMCGFHGRRFSQPLCVLVWVVSTHSVTRSVLFYNVMRPKFFKTPEMQMKLNCALLGYYAAYSGNYLRTSGNKLSVPSWRDKNPKRKMNHACKLSVYMTLFHVISWIIVSRYIVAACAIKMR